MILFDISLPLTFAVALRSVTCWSRETLKARRGGGCGAFAVKTKQMLFASKKEAKGNSSATYQTLRFVIVRLLQVSSTPVTDVFPARLAMQSQPSLSHADFFKGNNVRIGYNY